MLLTGFEAALEKIEHLSLESIRIDYIVFTGALLV